jgi:ABC-type dipeptide/oligopeptide/nickel transport system permease component
MIGFIIRRILVVIPTILGITVIIFMMLAITPGDPAELLLGERATKAPGGHAGIFRPQ